MAASTTKEPVADANQPGSLSKDEADQQKKIAKATAQSEKDANSTGVQKSGLQPPSLEDSPEQRLIDGLERAKLATDGPADVESGDEAHTSDKYVVRRVTDQYHREAVAVSLRNWVGPEPLIVAADDWDDFKKLVASVK